MIEPKIETVTMSTRLSPGDCGYRGLLLVADELPVAQAASEVMCLTELASDVCRAAIHGTSDAGERESLLHVVDRLCDLAHGLSQALYEHIERAEYAAEKAVAP